MSNNTVSPPSLKNTLISGAAKMVIARWIVRILGLLNIIILARLLEPSDFGLIAMSAVLVGALRVIFSLSIDGALIRNNNAANEDFDTAWTIGIMQASFIAAILFIFSVPIGDYFNDERVVDIVRLSALSVIITSFSNIGIVKFRKEFEYSKEVKFSILARFISLIATLSLAFYYKNYWGLVYGMVVGAILRVILSYIMNSYRPRLTLSKFKSLWSYSYWMIVLNTGMFLSAQGDKYIIGGQVSTNEYGLYTTAGELAELPTSELIFPISRALFPGFAKLKEDKKRLKSAVINIIGFLAGISIPLGLGLTAITEQFVYLVLGEKWLQAVPFIQCLALYGVIRVVYSTPRNLLVVLGKEKQLAALAWANSIVFLTMAYYIINTYDLISIAIMKVILALPFAFVSLLYIGRLLSISKQEYLEVMQRPIFSGLIMIVSLNQIPWEWLDSMLLILLIKTLTGMILYAASLITFWVLSNKPEGFESFVISLLTPYKKHLFFRKINGR
jgi:lipopolysaccharide exporter